MTIITRCNPPPIPIRDFDWTARLEGYDPDSAAEPCGYGRTEQEAIEDLKDQLEEEL